VDRIKRTENASGRESRTGKKDEAKPKPYQ
jgi:hypothetical protein